MTEAEALAAIANHLGRIADAGSPAKKTLGFGPAPKRMKKAQPLLL